MSVTAENPHQLHPICNDEDVGELRRAISRSGHTSTTDNGAAQLVATELATNVLKHGGGGYVLWRESDVGLEIIAVDRGPGLRPAEVARLRRQISHQPCERVDTRGGSELFDLRREAQPVQHSGMAPGLGLGLGIVVRMSDEVDLYSNQPGGTVVLARLSSRASRAEQDLSLRWGGVNVPHGGSGPSGDSWAVSVSRRLDREIVTVAVADGLGHGAEAAAASIAGVEACLGANSGEDPRANLIAGMSRAHEAMRSTRGGAISACCIRQFGENGRVLHGGVGNVSARLFSPGSSQALIGRDGTLGIGQMLPRLQVSDEPWAAGSTLVMATDGLRSRWDPLAYPQLLEHDPTVIAAVLHRDFARESDDSAVVVIKG